MRTVTLLLPWHVVEIVRPHRPSRVYVHVTPASLRRLESMLLGGDWACIQRLDRLGKFSFAEVLHLGAPLERP